MPFTPAGDVLHNMTVVVARAAGFVRLNVTIADGANTGRRFTRNMTFRARTSASWTASASERRGRTGGAALFGSLEISHVAAAGEMICRVGRANNHQLCASCLYSLCPLWLITIRTQWEPQRTRRTQSRRVGQAKHGPTRMHRVPSVGLRALSHPTCLTLTLSRRERGTASAHSLGIRLRQQVLPEVAGASGDSLAPRGHTGVGQLDLPSPVRRPSPGKTGPPALLTRGRLPPNST